MEGLQRLSRPQHLSSISPDSSPAQVFDFFYRAIFSFVHAALTTVLTPVLGKSKSKSDSSATASSEPAGEVFE